MTSFEQTSWMQARDLSRRQRRGSELVAYEGLIDQLAGLWRFPLLQLPARPENYEARTDVLTGRIMASATT
jgi:hypothetical protein